MTATAPDSGMTANAISASRERVAALGGNLQIQSAKGEGTLLTVRVPLAAATTPLPPGTPSSLVQDGAA